MESPPQLPDEQESTGVAHARAVGSRLRAVHHQTGLSLLAVEAMSNMEFRASVLGSYERGERSINVPRLQRLAKLYDVPVDQFLQTDGARPKGAEAEGSEPGRGPSHQTRVDLGKVSIDLAKLRAGSGPEHQLLRRFVGMIQVQRQDFNGRMITLRSGDLRAIACLLGSTPGATARRLGDLNLLVGS